MSSEANTESASSTEHDWVLKGGARGEVSKPSIPTGYALFQCSDCGIAAARQLTGRNSASLNSIVPTPEIDEGCEVGTGTDGGGRDV